MTGTWYDKLNDVKLEYPLGTVSIVMTMDQSVEYTLASTTWHSIIVPSSTNYPTHCVVVTYFNGRTVTVSAGSSFRLPDGCKFSYVHYTDSTKKTEIDQGTVDSFKADKTFAYDPVEYHNIVATLSPGSPMEGLTLNVQGFNLDAGDPFDMFSFSYDDYIAHETFSYDEFSKALGDYTADGIMEIYVKPADGRGFITNGYVVLCINDTSVVINSVLSGDTLTSFDLSVDNLVINDDLLSKSDVKFELSVSADDPQPGDDYHVNITVDYSGVQESEKLTIKGNVTVYETIGCSAEVDSGSFTLNSSSFEDSGCCATVNVKNPDNYKVVFRATASDNLGSNQYSGVASWGINEKQITITLYRDS